LIGFRDVDLAQNNDVYNGSVGVTSTYGDADFDRYCSVASPGAFVKAHDIDVKSNVTIPTKIYSPAVVTLPTMLLNTASLSGLSNYTKTSNGTVSGNYRDLCIWSNKTVTITGNTFRNIKIGHNCDVTFTASDISLEELDIDHTSTVHFSGNTIFRVKDHVDIDKGCTFNPEAKKVTFYIKDPSTNSHGCYSSYHNWYGSRWGRNDFEVDGQQTTVIANVYAPDGKIRVHGNGYNCHWNSNQSCTMTGLFIAEQIESDGKNVSWYSYDCGSSTMRQAAPMAQQEEAVAYELLVYPNPTDAQVTLQFASMEQPADVVITDMAGRVVRHQVLSAQSALSSTYDLSDQAAGVYLIQVRQGENSFRTKLILK
ncbi:MAG: T9SS type A sorting domain-containing protein, partial [Bacteroidetes bacterium]|nr:T9SS type A sorting domain-containing protein [Bacteroidota bacterium]